MRVGMGKKGYWAGLVVLAMTTLTGCCSLQPGGGGGQTPEQEIFDQEVVDIRVVYRGDSVAKVEVEPERAEIYFQWSRARRDATKPVQARWVVKGLRKEHVIHIVPKEQAPEGVFPIPNEFRDRPAYSIEGQFNSIVSGEVIELPALEREKGFVDPKARRSYDGEPYTVVWPYDIVVADRNGKALFELDPEIIIVAHPP